MIQTSLSANLGIKRMKDPNDPFMNPPSSTTSRLTNNSTENSIPKEFQVFINKYHKIYDWLYYGGTSENCGNYCRICQEYVKVHQVLLSQYQQSFILSASKNLKTSALTDPEQCHTHKSAKTWKYGFESNKEINIQALENFETDRSNIPDDDLIIHLLSTFYLSKENIALRKPMLLNLFELCNLQFNSNYRNDKGTFEFLESISQKVQENLMKEVCSSPYIGLMLDESTDICSQKYLVINIKYFYKNQIKERFCALINLHSADANRICSVVLDFLSSYKLQGKVAAISTDGASVMLGKDNGVAIKLKGYLKNENLIINHCLSHRLNLGAKDVWQSEPGLTSFNSTIHSLCSFFSKSSKKLLLLEEETESLLQTHLKLLKPIDIRWLSIYKVIERIYDLYPALISAIKITFENESCIIAEKLLSKMKSV